MSEDSPVSIDLDQDLVKAIEDALFVLKTRNSNQPWTRERVFALAIHHGLKQLLRQHPRKTVDLRGTLTKLVPEDLQGEKIRIQDISAGGIKFQTATPNQLMPNEILEVVFRLDDRHRTLINRKIVVSHLTGNLVGGKFCETDDAYHRISRQALEDYLQSKSKE